MDVKKIRRIFYTAVILGSFAIGIAAPALGLSSGARAAVIILWLAAVGISALIVNMRWLKGLNAEVTALTPLFDSDPDLYIERLTALLGGRRSKSLRQLLAINTAAAYCRKKDYARAEELLRSIGGRGLYGVYRPVHQADLALCLFYQGRYDDALAIMDENRGLFGANAENPQMGGLLAVLGLFELAAKGEYPKALELLPEARAKWGERCRDDLDYIERLCRK